MEHMMLARQLEALARRAGAALPKGPAALQVEDKSGKANYVTDYDRQTQQLLFAECLALVPDALMIGEESFETGGRLPDPASAARSFIIDPIDGTTNFIRGYRHSGISIAYLENGIVCVGVVYDPWQDECFAAVRGQGAWVNGVPMHTANADLTHCLLSFGSSPYYPELQCISFAALQAVFGSIADVRRSGSAALDLAYVASGRTDAFFEMRLSPWDVAAGSLLVQEAGGLVTDVQGGPLRLDAPGSLLAASTSVYEAIKAAIGSVREA